jgi:sugar/nucleoside kinase (ribokinase family)
MLDKADVPFVLTLASTRIVDGYRAFFATLAPKAQMVVGNLEQAAMLFGVKEVSLDAVRIALAQTPIDAVVTLDADGAFARCGDEEFFLPTTRIAAIDSTGAGDNFLAAFLVARKKGLSVRQALAVGNIVAGHVIQHKGARLPMSLDVPQLMQEAMHIAASRYD